MRNKDAEERVKRLLEKFEEVRKQQGLSHEKLAEKAGLHRSTVGLLENKKRIPTILTCFKIADALDVSLVSIIKEVS